MEPWLGRAQFDRSPVAVKSRFRVEAENGSGMPIRLKIKINIPVYSGTPKQQISLHEDGGRRPMKPSADGSNPAISGHRKPGHIRRPETGVEFYFIGSCSRKVVWTLVRQLRGPHLSTCA